MSSHLHDSKGKGDPDSKTGDLRRLRPCVARRRKVTLVVRWRGVGPLGRNRISEEIEKSTQNRLAAGIVITIRGALGGLSEMRVV